MPGQIELKPGSNITGTTARGREPQLGHKEQPETSSDASTTVTHTTKTPQTKTNNKGCNIVLLNGSSFGTRKKCAVEDEGNMDVYIGIEPQEKAALRSAAEEAVKTEKDKSRHID